MSATEEKKVEMVLHYFPVKSRGLPAAYLAAYFGKELQWNKPTMDEWKEMKEAGTSPFGQLPLLIHGDLKVGQSMAIVRYLGAQWDCDAANNLKDFGISEMLIEESGDIIDLMGNAMYKKGKAEQWEGKNNEARLAVAVGQCASHLTNLEKLMTDNVFHSSGVVTGDICLFHAINALLDNDAKALEKLPQLTAWYANIYKNEAVKKIADETTKYYHKTCQYAPE